jgi:UPF0755 protein
MRLTRLIGAFLLAALLVAGWAAFRLLTPYRSFQGETFVDLPHGTGAGGIADRLARAGALRNRWDFLLARVVERGRVLQAGEYRFQEPASALEVFDRIARGDVFYYTLVVPEGRNMFDIASDAASFGLFDRHQFLAAARDPAPVRDLDPQARTLEGYLFPGSYRLDRHTTPRMLCQKMTARFRAAWSGLGAPAGPHRTVTLASMVEKEAKLPEERPRIASVFENRLRLGMKLDCDPTTIYAALLEARYRGAIYRSDLENSNPYNTYQHAGLPPGPIANPGLASIQAVLHPEASQALYFVLRPDGSGAHQFSENLAQQSAAIARYRRARSR